MGAGFRTTSVYNQSSLEMDLYMSEYSEKYDLETSHLTKSEALNDLNSYKSDKYLGHFSLDENSLFSEPYNNSSDAFNVTSQYLVTKYVSEYLDAYYYHYSDDQHLLKFSGNAFSIFTTDSFIINTCSTFKSNLMSYDSKHLDIIIDIVGYVPYGGTAAAITQAITEVISNEGMTSDTLFDAVMILVTSIPGIGAIANTGLLVSDLALAYAYYHDAKNAYNTVKSYT